MEDEYDHEMKYYGLSREMPAHDPRYPTIHEGYDDDQYNMLSEKQQQPQ